MKLTPDTTPPTGGSSAGPFRSPARPAAATPPDDGRVVSQQTMRQVNSVVCPRCQKRIRIKTTTVTTTRKKVRDGVGADDLRKALDVAGLAAPVVRDILKALGIGS